MNILYLFPPQWMPISPHFALSSLMGQFEGTPHQVSTIDLNVRFYDEVLKSQYLLNSLKKARELNDSLQNKISKFYEKGKDFKSYTLREQNLFAKHVMIRNFLKENETNIKNIPSLIDGAVSIMRSKKHFYNPKLLLEALDIIKVAMDIISMPYYPTIISFSSYYNQLLKLNYESIKYYVFDKETNIFIDFYNHQLENIKNQNAKYIGISINSSSQIIAGLTLAALLKKETNSHINIGGNYFGRITKTLKKYPEFFKLFCDSLSIEEGERPVLELAKYINKEISIKKVPNLMYLEENKVCLNRSLKPLPLNKMKKQCLNGYELEKYFVPEIVLPIQSSRGCYWRKCSFCDHDFGQNYNIKNVDKLIDEITHIKKNYNIDKFEFIDEAISPAYLKEMSEKIIDKNLHISFFCDARTEDTFTADILNKAHKAGLKMILWGIESGSRKIMKLINKGVNFDRRLDILRLARSAGIFNFAFIFFGFPAETKEDAMKTIDLICNNIDIINVYGRSIFTMGNHTRLKKHPKEYGVIGRPRQIEEFSPTYSFRSIGMNSTDLKDVQDICTKRAFEKYGNSLVFQFLTRELLFLYLDKYGTDEVCKFKY